MLYVFYGNDKDLRQKNARAFFENSKWESRKHVIQNDIDIRLDEFRSQIESTSLFGDEYILVLDNVFANPEVRDYILSNLKVLEASPSVCIISEEMLSPGDKELLKKAAEKYTEYVLPKSKKKEWTPFVFTERVGMRDKKGAWMLYFKAIEDDKGPDEIMGALFWLLKTMTLVSKLPSGASSGLNPFVERNTRNYIKKYSTDELEKFRSDVVTLYHEIRRGLVLPAEGLEAVLLSNM